jgi:hypothetical protein
VVLNGSHGIGRTVWSSGRSRSSIATYPGRPDLIHWKSPDFSPCGWVLIDQWTDHHLVSFFSFLMPLYNRTHLHQRQELTPAPSYGPKISSSQYHQECNVHQSASTSMIALECAAEMIGSEMAQQADGNFDSLGAMPTNNQSQDMVLHREKQ